MFAAELCRLPHESSRVSRADIIEITGKYIRDNVDPDRDFIHGFRRCDDDLLKLGDWEMVDRLVKGIPGRWADVFKRLRVDGKTLAIPQGYSFLQMFAMMFNFESGPVVFQTADVRMYSRGAATVSWTKPSLPKRWANITLLGGGGAGGGGARVTTLSNDAAGGGGGGGGGLITRVALLSGLSSGDVVIGAASVSAGAQSTANTNGTTPSADGSSITFAGLTAGGGGKGIGGGQGTGAQTGSGGTGGAGDVAGGDGGTGRSGATVGSDGTTPGGQSGAGGGGGGGASADASQSAGGSGGNSFTTGTGGGAGGAAGGSTGGATNVNSNGGSGAGGGGGANGSSAGGGFGGSSTINAAAAGGGFGGGAGGGGGRARNAATQTGDGRGGGSSAAGFAVIISF